MNAGIRVMEGEFIDGAGGDPDLDADFYAFRDELSSGDTAEGTISVYKLPMDDKGNVIAKSKKQAWLFSMPIGGVSLIDIINRCKKEFMREGETAMTIRMTGHRAGKRGNELNKVYYIEKENEAPKSAPAPGQVDLAGILRAISDNNAAAAQRQETTMDRMMNMMLQLAQARAAPAAAMPASSGDPLAMMEKMMMMQTVMQKFAPMLGAAPAAAVSASDPVANLLGTIKVMKEMQSVMGGVAPPEEDGLMNGILKLAGPAMGLMAENEKTKRMLIAGRRGQVPRKPAEIVAAPASATEPTPEKSVPEGDAMSIMMFREQLKALCEMAAEGATAKDAADLVLQQMPEEYDEQLGELVSDENAAAFQSKIGTLFAGCKQHAAWFEELRVNLAAAFDDPDAANS